MPVEEKKSKEIEELFSVGAHYGYKKTRRHPSTTPFVFGLKNSVEIFDLEKTSVKLKEAEDFAENLAKEGGNMLFVSGKPEVKNIVVDFSKKADAYFVAGRWIGGTLTNFKEIRKQIERLKSLLEKKEKGELTKYTKHEQLLIDKDIKRLEGMFGGIMDMDELPKALFIIDPRQEKTATKEAEKLGIPVIALANTDCDITTIAYPIPANDSSAKSITFFVDRIATAYQRGNESTKTKKV